MATTDGILMDVKNLKMYFPVLAGVIRQITPVATSGYTIFSLLETVRCFFILIFLSLSVVSSFMIGG